jgi:DpnII restriction endonuclease
VETTTVTKDVIQILRETQYSITDPRCFLYPPKDEKEVHVRIEAVLRCVFPDLINKPRVNKQIKHFEPDTGLPGINTLIEYKFIGSQDDAKRVADEVLADTRGYTAKDWKQFIYVIYETKRIRPEKHWNQLLRESDVPDNTSIIVIHGEEPTRSKTKLPALKGAVAGGS